MLTELAGLLVVVWALAYVLTLATGADVARRRLLALWWPARTVTGRVLLAAAVVLLGGVPLRLLGVAVPGVTGPVGW